MTAPVPAPARPAEHRVVDLFAGPGGLDIACEVLGIPAVGIEWDGNAVATRKAAGLDTEHGDVRDFRPDRGRFRDCNVLVGGPPCQTFTVAGTGSGRRALQEVKDFIDRLMKGEPDDVIDAALEQLEDERTGLVLEPLRWALKAHAAGEPYEVVVLEQVPAVLPVWEKYASALSKLGYSVDYGVLKTEQYGVPQSRRRAVLVARTYGPPVSLPAPTHQEYRKGARRGQCPHGLQAWVAMGDVLERGFGFRTMSNYGSGGDPKKRGRRSASDPAATVTGKVSRVRVVTDDDSERQLDRLTPGEMGLLQCFPKEYPWSGGDLAQQIGNAVPPRLAVQVLTAALGLSAPETVWDDLHSWAPPVRSKAQDDSLTAG